jgi:hypothetical protein
MDQRHRVWRPTILGNPSIQSDFLIDSLARGLERLVVFALGFVKQAADEPIVQIENLVSECGRRFQQDGHQAAIPAFVIEPDEMLNGGSTTLTGKLQQSILVDALTEIGWQLDCPDSLEAFDMGEDIARTWYA